jgi:hypothetical protein
LHQHHPPIPLISGDNILLNPSSSGQSLSSPLLFIGLQLHASTSYKHLFSLHAVTSFFCPFSLFSLGATVPFCSSFLFSITVLITHSPFYQFLVSSSYLFLFSHQSLISSSQLLLFSHQSLGVLPIYSSFLISSWSVLPTCSSSLYQLWSDLPTLFSHQFQHGFLSVSGLFFLPAPLLSSPLVSSHHLLLFSDHLWSVLTTCSSSLITSGQFSPPPPLL